MSDWSDPAARAHTRRIELGISDEDVATTLGVELAQYRAFEAGEPTLGAIELRQLAKILQMTADELLLGDHPAHVLLRADDGAEASDAVECAGQLIEEYLLLEALVGP